MARGEVWAKSELVGWVRYFKRDRVRKVGVYY